jgi:hypothetical protein
MDEKIEPKILPFIIIIRYRYRYRSGIDIDYDMINVRCFGPWAKQFQINTKGPLTHACIYGMVGDFSSTLLLQEEWCQLK